MVPLHQSYFHGGSGFDGGIRDSFQRGRVMNIRQKIRQKREDSLFVAFLLINYRKI